MSRLILAMQLPIKMRYQEFFYTEFPKHFKKYFDDIIILGEPFLNSITNFTVDSSEEFSSVSNSINLEHIQIQQYLNMKIYDDDILFLLDISYPGIFSNILYHKKIKNLFAYCHASSINPYDYFQKTRKFKWKNETLHSKLFKKIFVGSEYHKNKLGWKNVEVVSLPKPPFEFFNLKKDINIISVARPCKQKINKKIEGLVERDFCKIFRKKFHSWEDYYKHLSKSKVLLISSKIDTFNYSIVESIMNNTIVIAPNKCSYPELLPKEYLYNNYEELKICLNLALEGKLKVPKLKNKKMIHNFYKNVSRIMIEGV